MYSIHYNIPLASVRPRLVLAMSFLEQNKFKIFLHFLFVKLTLRFEDGLRNTVNPAVGFDSAMSTERYAL